jgi:hypothetical protein
VTAELERRQPNQPAPVSGVDSWVDVMRPLVQLAEHVHGTDFVPSALRGNAPAVAAAMLYGRELGMGPMRSLQTVHVIDGRPTLSAEQMRGMVLAAGHEIVYRETTKTRCLIAGRRKNSGTWTEVSWTLDDAKQMELLGKKNWRRSPRQMLVARATAELARMVFADVVGGMYSTEEVSDGGFDEAAPIEATATEAPPEPAKPRTAKRRSTPKQAAKASTPAAPPSRSTGKADEPPLPGEPGAEDEPADGQVTRAQLDKLHAQLGELNITDRADKLVAVGLLVRRQLASSNELTKRQASQAIESLTRVLAHDDPPSAFDALLGELERQEQEESDAQQGGDSP